MGSRLRSIGFCFLLLLFVGCDEEQKVTSYPVVEGTLIQIQVAPEDHNYTTVFLYFEDGRVSKLRTYYNKPLYLKMSAVNRFYYNDRLEIVSVEINPPALPLP